MKTGSAGGSRSERTVAAGASPGLTHQNSEVPLLLALAVVKMRFWGTTVYTPLHHWATQSKRSKAK